MTELPVISGGEAIKILANRFGFKIKKQRGSHVKMIHPDGRKTTVPLHPELDRGTLKSALGFAQVDIEEFKRHI